MSRTIGEFIVASYAAVFIHSRGFLTYLLGVVAAGLAITSVLAPLAAILVPTVSGWWALLIVGAPFWWGLMRWCSEQI